ncbi:MAG: DMT family transporter [Bacteroidetes bacterium]|nr:MAG: DMT family transporter [Bacteroidota bacterium]
MNKAISNILLSGFFLALMNVLVRYADNYSVFQLIFFRALVTLLISYAVIKKHGLNPFGNDKKHLILRGVFGFIGLTLYYLTLKHMPLAAAVSIQYLSPVFTAVLAIFINKQKMSWFTWLFYALAFAGVLVIRGFDARIELLILLAGIGSAVASGAAYNMIRKIGKNDDPNVVVFYFPLVTLPLVLIPAINTWIWPKDMLEWLILIGIGITTQYGQVFMTRAFQHSNLAGVAIFQYFGIFYALGFGYFLFSETYNWLSIAGMFLVIAGAVGNALAVQYKAKKEAALNAKA